MTLALSVHDRWIVRGPARRARALRAVAGASLPDGITHSVTDCPDVGALGLPFWTVIDFTAEHGDYDRLARDARRVVARDAELAETIEPLTVESRWARR